MWAVSATVMQPLTHARRFSGLWKRKSDGKENGVTLKALRLGEYIVYTKGMSGGCDCAGQAACLAAGQTGKICSSEVGASLQAICLSV